MSSSIVSILAIMALSFVGVMLMFAGLVYHNTTVTEGHLYLLTPMAAVFLISMGRYLYQSSR